MFGKMIYYDQKSINEYYAFAKGKERSYQTEMTYSKGKKASIETSVVSAGADSQMKSTFQMMGSLLLDCVTFEKALEGRDDYLDFTSSDQYDINTANRGTIIKFKGYIEIPEQFDMVQLLNTFAPAFENSSTIADMNQEGISAAKIILSGSKTYSIPISSVLDDYLLCAKIRNDNLLVMYDELEDIMDEEVTFLAKISSEKIDPGKCVYDPLKDFMHLNRATRKHAPETGKVPEILEKIYVEENYRTIEVLAIYE